MTAKQSDNFRVTRLICTALVSGVTLFWVVSWVVTAGGSEPLYGGGPSPSILLLGWGALAFPGFGAALHFRNRASAAAATRRQPPAETEDDGLDARAQSATIVAHAMLEAPALLAGVIFLLFGNLLLAWTALPVYALGVLLTWPQPEWFSDR